MGAPVHVGQVPQYRDRARGAGVGRVFPVNHLDGDRLARPRRADRPVEFLRPRKGQCQ